ncbi:glycoside hydrolase family 3 C-terminal domain-containing protein [Companilactobacillus allii]|uniref:Glycoside hydrolase family 3 n=1 Tax=Companilactobacillus allii TaxID=1847728 RepID=A0A1P8Q5W6_9LACO|nr:glycoside hydrolase family 3 protein [Companilactobacillus allii]APX73258.1 glycoside hydrolase family 3 [Companilactobacillus allii]USQ68074.1 glycoside hydrolase family 3 C-terminal domain-containing protein [Companilactobacillus allii]
MEQSMSQREINNLNLSKKVAQDGMVLLQNENKALPLRNKKVALYGSGSFATVKGGTGSGDVNQRHVSSIIEGLEADNFEIANKSWLMRFQKYYDSKKKEYYDNLDDSLMSLLAPAFSMDDMEIGEFVDAPIGIYVISRSSGEGQDRKNEKGDYQLTDNELSNIKLFSEYYQKSILLLNVGGVIDTDFIEKCPLLDSVLLISQPGMAAGEAVAEVLDGSVIPSGKLTDTWAFNYEDYPSAKYFGEKNPRYNEGIYVGYRYFDSFNITPRYEFGFGLSYAKFLIDTVKISGNEQKIDVSINVQNSSETFSGKEVVQLYVSNPQSEISTPYQSLQAYAKTDLLKPSGYQKLNMSFDTKNLAVYDQKNAQLVMIPGTYLIRVGNSSRNTTVVGKLKLDEKVILRQFEHKLAPLVDPTEIKDNKVLLEQVGGVPFILLKAKNFEKAPEIKYTDYNEVKTYSSDEDTKLPGKGFNETIENVPELQQMKLIDVLHRKISLKEFVGNLSKQELIDLVEGSWKSNNSGSMVGNASQLVFGAAGETTGNKRVGIPATVNADGPAGLRLSPEYKKDGKTHFQYATAWPIGTMLAQTWNQDIVKQVGVAIGNEMKEFGVTMWLAPGMNIHRNPLGGRNFEYFSEDPLLSGTMATAETLGVQSHTGIGVVIKHFLGNNQETKRNTGDSIIGEQALREIYLKNFEIAVKSAQPMGIMSSYNKVNGIYSGENYELLTNVLRDEWNFQGLVMTDWFSLADPVHSMHSGNDLIMPGGSQDKLFSAVDNLRPEFDDDGSISIRKSFDVETFKQKYNNLWNDFELAADGDNYIRVNITEKINESMKRSILNGTVQIIDDNTLLLKGNWKDNNDLYIGDLQKSAMRILNVVMRTDRFAKENGLGEIKYNQNMELDSYFG